MTRYYKLRKRALWTVSRYWGRRIECFGREAHWCGGRESDLLEFDHKDGDGMHSNRQGGDRRLRSAIAHPERFQLLCGHHHARKTRRAGENNGWRRRVTRA